MMNISQQSLSPTQLERTLGVPPGGPKMLPIALDFSVDTVFQLDYQNTQARGFLDMVQTLWVDNSLNAAILAIAFPLSQQTLKIPAGVQGYFTCLCPNPIKITFTSTGGVMTQVTLLNFPVWS